MIREEAYYFAPQAQTKILNEGWACVAPDTPILTEKGLIPMEEVVSGGARLAFDGEKGREIYDRNIIPNLDTITISTELGFQLSGSTNHRIMLENGQWKRLDQVELGEPVKLALNSNFWPRENYQIDPKLLQELSSLSESSPQLSDGRRRPALPSELSPKLARFLGLAWPSLSSFEGGDGFSVRLNSEPLARELLSLSRELFSIEPEFSEDRAGKSPSGTLYLLRFDSKILARYIRELVRGEPDSAGLPRGILRSPREVVGEFIRGLQATVSPQTFEELFKEFAPEAFEREQIGELLHSGAEREVVERALGLDNIYLAISSKRAALELQLLLLNFGLPCKRVEGTTGAFNFIFLPRELENVRGDWLSDRISSIEWSRGDVYDISVSDTHRYVGGGFINHNSYWHSKIMTERALKDSEIIDFADAHSAVVATSRTQLNPYKLGLELLRDIEDRWNKGRFGPEYEECDDMYTRLNWDLKLGEGMKKIFQVRKIYNDVTFIDEFLTEEFCARHKLFGFDYNRSTGQYEISTRDFKKIKEKLLFQLTNFGQPFIRVLDANFENRAELLLGHRHEGVDLHIPYAKAVLQNIYKVWKRPVHISTKIDGKGRLLSFDGTDLTMREYEYIEFDE